MIAYYLGIPGSGKSYAGVYTIFNNFSDDPKAKKDLKKDYISCFTNINQFNFDKVKNVYKFDFNQFYKHLTSLHRLYKKKEPDSVLIEKAKEFNIYKTLFVIDECHNFFDREDAVLVWWLTYHRHLYHDIFLITQNLALVHSKYKPLAEAFYMARPSSLKLSNKNFQYVYYTDKRLSKDSRVNIVKYPKVKEVFELYHSGDEVKSKNVVLHFVVISAVLLLILFIAGYYFFATFVPDDHKAKKDKSSHPATAVKNRSQSSTTSVSEGASSASADLSDKRFVKISCSLSSCTFGSSSFDPHVMTFLKEQDGFSLVYKKRVNARFYVFYALVDSSIYNAFFLNSNGVENNEESVNLLAGVIPGK